MRGNTQIDQRGIRSLGKYELIARLGVGGMAEVFLARQRGPMNFEKVVVVKSILPNLVQNEQNIAMLLDEARIAARVKHPNVVDIYDLGVEDGQYFIAMEYLAGETMLDVLRMGKRRAPLSVAGVVRAIADVAAGLHAAHELKDRQGLSLELVHRDVSPGNVIVLYTGHVKIVDFGIAKARGRIAETSALRVKGKLGYMSPEQIHNNPIDRRSDIFQLGVVLWESLAMRRLFHAHDISTLLTQVTRKKVEPPSQHRPEVPAVLDEICMRALQRKPSRRFATALEMQQALEHALEGLESVDPRSPWSTIGAYMREMFGEQMALRERVLQEVAVATSPLPPLDQARSGPRGKAASGLSIRPPGAGSETDFGDDTDEFGDDPTEVEAAGDHGMRLPLPAPSASGHIRAAHAGRAPTTVEVNLHGDELGSRAASGDIAVRVQSEPSYARAGSIAPTIRVRGEETDSRTAETRPRRRLWWGLALAVLFAGGVYAGTGGRLPGELSDEPLPGALALQADEAAADTSGEIAATAHGDDGADRDRRDRGEHGRDRERDRDNRRAKSRVGDDDSTSDDDSASDDDSTSDDDDDSTSDDDSASDDDSTSDDDSASDDDAPKAAASAGTSRRSKRRTGNSRRTRKSKGRDRGSDSRTPRPSGGAGGDAPPANPRVTDTGKPDPEPAADPQPSPASKADPADLYREGVRLFVDGKHGAAEQKFKAALEVRPGYSRAYRGLGMVYEKKGDVKAAVRAFQTYLKLSPNASDRKVIEGRLAAMGG